MADDTETDDAAAKAEDRKHRQLLAMEPGGTAMAIIPQSLGEVVSIAKAIAASGLAPYGMNTPDKVTVAIMMGLELGLPPMQAIQNIAVVNGKPSLYGDIGLSLIYRSNLLEEFEEGYEGEEPVATADFPNTFKAWCKMKRRGQPARTMEFTVADAKRANLWDGMGLEKDKQSKSPWHLHPKVMLRWRARWPVMRALFTDVLKNMAGAEELQDSVIDVTPNEPAAPNGKPKADIGAALKSGEKVEVVYTSGRKPAEAPKPEPTGPDGSFSGTGAEEAIDVEVLAGYTTEADEGAHGEAGGQETTIQPEPVEVDLDGITDIFEQGALTELATALLNVHSTAEMKVLEDEFATTVENASQLGAERMRKMIQATAELLVS